MIGYPRNNYWLVLTVALGAALFVGCKKDKTTPEVVEDTSGSEAPAPEPDFDANAGQDDSLSRCSIGTVYFAYDSAELDKAARDEIKRAGECFRKGETPARLQLVGAADPRGTEEYNLALGERRAQAVRRYLTSLGVPGNGISVSSVGEEMARGTDEAGWARDRNVTGTGN